MNSTEKAAALRALSLEELKDWGGPKIVQRGQQYAGGGHVSDLAQTSDGALLAWVLGTERYATLVDIDEGGLESFCTCPYDATCKHALALVLAFQQGDLNRPLPVVGPDDRRLRLLEQDEDEDSEPERAVDATLQTYLATLPKEQLAGLLLDLAAQFPEVQRALSDRLVLTSNNSALLVRDIQRLLDQASRYSPSYDEWDDYDEDDDEDRPDFGAIRKRLEHLLAQGEADKVVAFGDELLATGERLIEETQDEDGEIQSDVGDCMKVVFQALRQASKPLPERLQQAIDWRLADKYDLCSDAGIFLDHAADQASWSQVADQLLKRLGPTAPAQSLASKVRGRMVLVLPRGNVDQTPASSFRQMYEREKQSEWAIRALERAGREEEILPLCEREAEHNHSYVRLVKRLLAAGRTGEAEEWIAKGIVATRAPEPGIARQLRDLQMELWEQTGQWAKITARRANLFFSSPSLHELHALRTAANRASVWPQVHAAALHYLETGERPGQAPRKGRPAPPALPLPELETVMVEDTQNQPSMLFPAVRLLIELALEEQRPEDVLRWYQQCSDLPHGGIQLGNDYAIKVAQAIDQTHPDEAAAIWRQLAEQAISSGYSGNYPAAGDYLRKLHGLLKRQAHLAEWRSYLDQLRRQHARKRRFIEILDQLDRL